MTMNGSMASRELSKPAESECGSTGMRYAREMDLLAADGPIEERYVNY